MAKINITKGELLSYYNELTSWKQNKTIMNIFLAPKIKEFMNLNSIRINSMLKQLNDIDTQFYQHEVNKDGTIHYAPGKDLNGKRLLIEGKTDQERNAIIFPWTSEEITVDI